MKLGRTPSGGREGVARTFSRRRRPATVAGTVAASALVLLAAAGCATSPAVDHPLVADLGQMLLVGFAGTGVEGNEQVERLLCGIRVGGVVLFEPGNIRDPDQLAALTAALHRRARQCTGAPLLIAVDAEGGEAMRLAPRAGFAPTLSHRDLGETNDLAVTELEARRIGGMLRSAGIDWNLAPVVDVGYNPANPVIVGRGRSFAANPARVTAQARAYLRGMRAAGVLTTLKHFPGHGSSYGDTHEGFVDVTETANADIELAPYQALLAEGLADGVMTAHVVNRRLDPGVPATLSRATLEGLLRQRLGFDGLIVSDDMRMAAIARVGSFADVVVRAVEAGVDLLLISDDRLDDGRSAAAVAVAALSRAVHDGRLPAERAAASIHRIRRLKQPLATRA